MSGFVLAAECRPDVESDAQLIERFRAGDSKALDVLFYRYRTVAYRVAYRLLGHEADALDAVQEGFVKSLTRLDSFAGRSSFKTWLLRIVSNAALDLGRQRRRHEQKRRSLPDHDASELALVAPVTEPTQTLEQADLRQALDAALTQLPEPQRRTFVLHVDGELSYREVADVLGISMGTVMSRLFYARQKLRSLLEERSSQS